MAISTNNQLIPYYPDQRQVIHHTAKISGLVPVFADRRLTPYNLPLQPELSDDVTRTDLQEPEYNSNCRLKMPKINQVGLLIDIYA
jgi:hypothetical protein